MTEEWRDLEKDLELCEQMPGDDMTGLYNRDTI